MKPVDDLLPNDPLLPIFNKRREEKLFFKKYISYQDYLYILKKIGERLKEDYRKFDELNIQINQYMENPESLKNSDANDTYILYRNRLRDIYLDQESFIFFSKIFLDKLGVLIEILGDIRHEKSIAHQFKGHKKWCTEEKNFKDKPNYSQLQNYSKLVSVTNWYELLLIIRDKIVAHGGTLSTIFIINQNGIRHLRKIEIFRPLSEEDKGNIQKLIEKYGNKYENIKNIPPNPVMMLDEFIDVAFKDNINLDQVDLDKLAEIIQRNGGTIDAVILAEYIRKFLDNIAILFI